MLLEAQNLEAGYGATQVLFDVSLEVGEGEVVTLIGRNGMGKTTTVGTIMGLVRPRAGEIRFRGERIDGLAPHRIARLGLGLVPEGRRIFPNLSVRENLAMAAADRAHAREPWTVERVLDFFPRLRARLSNRGTQLFGRALVTNPSLLILDEATEGLAPIIREEIWARLHALKRTGLSIIVIDKEVEALAELADRYFVLEKGEMVWSGDTAALKASPEVQERYLGV
jgi:branched-chain amino acid transport system ATP-binding protein